MITIAYLPDLTLYLRVWNASFQVWNTSTLGFEVWNDANVAAYAVAMNEDTPGHYSADFPADISAGTYNVSTFVQDGGGPAITDAPGSGLGTVEWDGSAEIPASLEDVTTTVAKIETMLEDGVAGASRYTEAALIHCGSGGAFNGEGSVSVDWDYGGGDYRYLTSPGGQGIDNASIFAYLKTDYDNDRREVQYIQAQTWTNVDGEWRDPMYLDPGTYTLYYFRQGEYGPDTLEITVT